MTCHVPGCHRTATTRIHDPTQPAPLHACPEHTGATWEQAVTHCQQITGSKARAQALNSIACEPEQTTPLF